MGLCKRYVVVIVGHYSGDRTKTFLSFRRRQKAEEWVARLTAARLTAMQGWPDPIHYEVWDRRTNRPVDEGGP